jgi:hypothetical protein
MTLRRIIAFAVTMLSCSAHADSQGPISTAFAGAMRSGIEQEAAFGNPAALGPLNYSFIRGIYGKSGFASSDSGGKEMAFGAYDGQNPNAHAGIEYTRESRAINFRGQDGYLDRGEVRLAVGRALWGNIFGGLTLRHLTVRDGGPEDKVFNWDLGVLIPLASDLRIGVLAENLAQSQRDTPSKLGAGVRYQLGAGLVARGDFAELRNGDRQGQKFWAAALEIEAVADFTLRGGVNYDPHTETRSKALGLGWTGPRAVFDYGFTTQNDAAKERRHLFALTILI